LTVSPFKILVYGYGNPGRQDDGLGTLLAEEVDRWCTSSKLAHVSTDTNYQLNVEDAAEIADYNVVIFADASLENIESYSFEPLLPSNKTEFTMHAVSPAFILHLCQEMFGHKPEAYLLHIRGYEWEFMEEVTEGARENLAEAVSCVKQFIMDYSRPIA
jgi:hydrogenase maturation protease